MIPSEPEHFCLDKLIPEAFPLLVPPPVVRLVHLQKLLCGVILYRSSPSNALPISVLRAGNRTKSHRAVRGVHKGAGSQFGPVNRSNAKRHLRNSVREFYDQTSCNPNYKVALSPSAGASHYHELTMIRFLCSC